MRVTVAICTWNRARLLDQTLAAMHRLIIPDSVEWELLVVNNNCSDQTDEVIAAHAGALPIRRLFEPTAGKSHAANRAIDEASGDLILWTDDDVLVDEGWLAALIAAARRHPDAGGFGGPIDPWFPVPPDPALVAAFPALERGFCGLDHEADEGPSPEDKPIWGANMAFKRAAVEGIRFDPSLGPSPKLLRSGGKERLISIGGGEEEEFIARLRERGDKIVWVPTMQVRHYVAPERMTLEYLCSLYIDAGRNSIRLTGVPSGPRCFGIPRWLLRQWLEASLRYTFHRLSTSQTSALTWLRQRCYFEGMIQECRTIHRPLPNWRQSEVNVTPKDRAELAAPSGLR
jgi:glycosyltransferase involved in cell wall biosynthesis